jgi:DNA repair protein RecO (recombination protein O)
MPEYRTQGLVLRTFDQGESDRLVHLYTPTLGRVSAIAKGARRSKRRFPGTLEIFNLLDLRIVDPPRSSLMRVEAAQLRRAFEGLTRELGRYAIACMLLELLDRFTGEGEANPDLFHFATGVLGVVDEEKPDALLALLILLKTLARLGFRPELVRCASCGRDLAAAAEEGTLAFAPRHGGAVCAACAEPHEAPVQARLLLALEAGIRSPLRERAALGLAPAAVREAQRLVDRFFRFHIGLELRCGRFVQSILDDERARGDTAPPSGGGSRSTARSAPRP